MEKNYALFKKYLPIIIVLSVVGLIFGVFAIAYSYNKALVSINFSDVIPVFWMGFLGLSYIMCFVFTFQVKGMHIKRLKKNSSFSKFAALLAAGLVTALFLFNFFQFVQQKFQLPAFKIVRLIFSVPFIAYLIVGIIPKRFRRKQIKLPKWLLPISAVCALTWCILSILAIYFWSGEGALPTTNFFRLTHMFYLVVTTLFLLAEIGFEMFAKGHRFYILTASCLFVTTVVLTGSTTAGMFLGKISTEMSISAIEIFVGVALGVYALSKLFAMQYTMKYVMKQEKNGNKRRHHHHHHRHHHHHSDDKATTVVKADTDSIPTDIDI